MATVRGGFRRGGIGTELAVAFTTTKVAASSASHKRRIRRRGRRATSFRVGKGPLRGLVPLVPLGRRATSFRVPKGRFRPLVRVMGAERGAFEGKGVAREALLSSAAALLGRGVRGRTSCGPWALLGSVKIGAISVGIVKNVRGERRESRLKGREIKEAGGVGIDKRAMNIIEDFNGTFSVIVNGG